MAPNIWVVAQTQVKLEQISESFQNRPTGWFNTLMFLFLVGFIVVLVAIGFLQRKRERKESLNDHHQLYLELSDAHGLDRPMRLLLRELASQAKLKDPDILFVRRDVFQEAAAGWRKENPRRETAPLVQLENMLFGSKGISL